MFQFIKKIFSPLEKLSTKLGEKISSIFSSNQDPKAFEKLEKVLYEADLGTQLTLELVEKAKKIPPDRIVPFVKDELLSLFPKNEEKKHSSPHIILIVGINGSGKTTTVAKLAHQFVAQHKKVLVGAADTFRAAAIEQLEHWSQKVGASIVKSQPMADPASVAFDTAKAALSRGADVVLIDTAGRLQNKKELMEQLAKIKRSIGKVIPEAPHDTYLILDANIGQNGLDQVKSFQEVTNITGIILTKLDGSAKGGIAAAIQKQTKIPILWVGLGEKMEDLYPFNPQDYIEALFK